MPQQKQLKVLLIGDSCTDEYVYGSCERLNPEAPVPILKFNRKETKKGMAWNVRENIESFGIEVYMITNQETITKTRYIDEKYNQQILRVDDVLLEVIREFNPSTFVVDNSGEMNKQLIGAWVAHLDCDRVVRERGNKILICKTIEDAIIIE